VRKILHFAKHSWLLFARACKSVFLQIESFYHLTIIIATIVAGYWTYHLFIAERHTQAHLALGVGITISTNSPVLGDKRLVFLDVILTNTGKRKLEAKRVPANQAAYKDQEEVIKYSCGVQVREIQTSLILTNKSLDWFADTNYLRCPVGIPEEIDMLGEYELANSSDPSIYGIPAFWIEPNEQYHLGTALILSKGDYLLKIHFIGNYSDEDFWSRIVYMQVY
jgi:hypothetical protein